MVGLCCFPQTFSSCCEWGIFCFDAWGSRCGGLLPCGAQAIGEQVSVVAANGLSSCGSRALEHVLSSCDTHAQLLCSMWECLRPGIELCPLPDS